MRQRPADFGGGQVVQQRNAISSPIIRSMRKTTRSRRLMLRISEPLADKLEASAQQQRRTVAEYARQLLIDAVAARIAQDNQPTGA